MIKKAIAIMPINMLVGVNIYASTGLNENGYISEHSYSNKSTYYTDKQGEYLKCQFYGRYISIGINRKERYGVADVYINEKKVTEIDYVGVGEEDIVNIDVGQVGYHSMRLIKSDVDGKSINITDILVVDEDIC